jgi:multicomponent Na+:H+ antiporter subunit D
MTPTLILPVAIPLGAAILALSAWGRPLVQRAIGLVSALALLGFGLWLVAQTVDGRILVTQMGGWPAPFGITFVADLFSALMVAVTGLMGLSVVVYSFVTIPPENERYGYQPLLQALLAGVSGAFLTGDLFNMFVWFEVMLISSFVLLALGGGGLEIEGGIKYVALNLISSALFLAALGILYGVAGTLNMADLARTFATTDRPGVVTTLAMLFLAAFGIKAAVFPVFFWLPASYHTPPVAVSAIFAGLLTKVGVYALIRVFTLIFMANVGFTHGVILAIAGFTMITGVLGALSQHEFRRVLSFHIVSQIGYMVMGLGLFTPLALAASVFYIVHHIIVKTNLFLIGGIVERLRGTQDLGPLGGIYKNRPALALVFLVPAMSLAGVPPLSGFFGKLALLQASLDEGAYLIAAVAVIVSLFTLMSMTKLWNEAFWKTPPGEQPDARGEIHGSWPGAAAVVAPVILLAGLTILIGLGVGPLFAVAQTAADQLLDPQAYITAVLGAGGGR